LIGARLRGSIPRRAFLGGLAAAGVALDLGLRLGPAWSREINRHRNRNIRFLDHDDAVAEGIRRDIGRAELISPARGGAIVAAEHAALTFRYTVGTTPIYAGGFVWVTMRHVFHSTLPQNGNPAGDGYVRVEGPPGATLALVLWPNRADGEDLFLRAFPWQHPIEVRVDSGTLNPGDTVTIHYGDRSGGGRGVRVQPSQEPGFAFRVYVSPAPNDPILPLADDLVLPIVGGLVERLSLIAPATASPGATMRVLVRAEDRFGNQAVDYSGTLVLTTDDGRELSRHAVGAEQRGILWLEVEPFSAEGVIRFRVEDEGRRSSRSNPIRVTDDPARRVLFGDTHGHSVLSDGRGSPEEYYAYARDVAALDFCVLTDHDFMLSDEVWDDIQAVTESFNAPGRFATIHAFEWSGMTEVGGDHNVYFRSDRTAITRCRSYYDYRNQQSYHGREPQTNHVEDLYAFLLNRFEEGEVMVIPHFGGRPANPVWHEPRLERMIEIYSDHRRSHDWAYQFVDRGHRLGILASSDNHTGRPGYGFLQNPLLAGNGFEVGTALAAIYAPEIERGAIFDALFARHAYATSGDRVLLAVTMGEARMGQESAGAHVPPIVVEAEGTAPIAAIEFMKDGALVHTVPGSGESMRVEWQDPTPPSAALTATYWVRIAQENGEEAISSPIWWTTTA
jgi:hypothetical protein